jgi:hypothetical protein
MMKPLRVEPELTDDFIDYVKGEAKSMVAAKRLKAEPDWSKVMAPELVEKARAG